MKKKFSILLLLLLTSILYSEENKDLKFYYKKALLNYNENKYSKALEYIEKAIELEDEAYFLYTTKGDCLRRLKKFEEALTSYNQAIKLNNTDWECYFSRAAVFFEIKNMESAYSDFKKSFEYSAKEHEKYFSAYFSGILAFILHKHNESIIFMNVVKKCNIQELLKLDKSFNEFIKAYYLNGMSYIMKQEWKTAIDELVYYKNNADYNRNRRKYLGYFEVYAYIKNNELKKAYENISPILSIEPDDLNLYVCRIIICKILKEYTNSEEEKNKYNNIIKEDIEKYKKHDSKFNPKKLTDKDLDKNIEEVIANWIDKYGKL